MAARVMPMAVSEPPALPVVDAAAPASSGRRRLLGNALIYTAANILQSAIPFLLLPLLTRVLTPEQYGRVAIFMVLTAVFGAFSGLSVHGAVNVRYFDKGTDIRRYLATVLLILACSTSVLLLVVLVASPWLTSWTELPFAALASAVLAATAQFIINIRLVMWQVQGMAMRYGLFQVAQVAFNLGLSLVLIMSFGLGWQGRTLGIVCALLAFAAIGLLTLQQSRLLDWRPTASYAKDAMRFGVPLIPHVIGTLFIASSDRLMVAGMLSVSEAGVYAAGMQVGMVVAVLADASVKAVSPWLYSRLAAPDAATKCRVVRFTYMYFAAIVAASLVFAAAAPHLLLLVGKEFRSNPEVTGYVAVGGAFGGMYLMVVNYIFLAKRNELLSIASVSVGLLNLAASYHLVRAHGAVGAAQAYAASQFLLFMAIWAVSHRCYPMPWRAALRWGAPSSRVRNA